MKQVDVVVIGGGLRGCMAAKRAAALGCQTVIVERRGSLGYELAATRHAWLQNGGSRFELPVLLGSLKKYLMREMLDRGVQPLVGTAAAGLALARGGAVGLLLGNKFGLQFLQARGVIDTEESAFAFAPPSAAQGPVRYVLEFDGAAALYGPSLEVAPSLGLDGNAVALHPGVRTNSLLVEFSFTAALNQGRNTPSILLGEAQLKGLSLAQWLRTNTEIFSGAALCAMGQEVWFDAGQASAQGGPFENYLPLTRRLPFDMSTRLLEQTEEEVGRAVEAWLCNLPQERREPEEFLISAEKIPGGKIPAGACGMSPFDDEKMPVPLVRVQIDSSFLPVQAEAPVLVAGAGTAGSMTARALYEKKVPTLLVDCNSQAGGTSGVGLVCGYWHGYRGGLNRLLDEEAFSLSAALRPDPSATDRIARQLCLQRMVRDHRRDCYFDTLLCGVLREGNRIAGVMAVDSRGLFLLRADITVDATGDGDAAYLAGLPYFFGNPRDGMTQSYSQWGMELWNIASFRESRYQGDFDVVYNDKYSDWLRGVYLAHGRNSDYDFTDMLTLRESRRVQGEAVLTMRDIYLEQVPEDCVGVTQTPFDTHGLGSSLFCGMGLCGCFEELRARIPYRCYLPKDTEGLYITAKAFSATRDAASVCRMNADLRHAGYMIGLAAAQAVTKGCGVREIDIAALQRELLEKEILPAWALKPEPMPVPALLAEQTARGDAAALFALLHCDREEALTALRAQKERGSASKNLALALGWMGDAGGLRETAAWLAAELPLQTPEEASRRSTDDSNHYWNVNRCLAVLGLQGGPEALDAVIQAAAQAGPGGPVTHAPTPYSRSRIDGWRVPCYEQLRLLAFALERLADPKAIPVLDGLLRQETLSGYVTADPSAGEAAPFFCSYLELCLARALARCGGVSGAQRLADYVADTRYVLSSHARRELAEITGEDFGFDSDAWKQWLSGRQNLPAVPYGGPVTLY